jgi:hypothetical protein
MPDMLHLLIPRFQIPKFQDLGAPKDPGIRFCYIKARRDDDSIGDITQSGAVHLVILTKVRIFQRFITSVFNALLL